MHQNAKNDERKIQSQISCLDHASLDIISPQTRPLESQSLQQKVKNRKKRKGKKIEKNRKA